MAPPTVGRAPNRLRATAGERATALVVAMLLLGVLIVASQLNADPSGHGTHRQLGLPPCGWVLRFEKPCPTCGMTTAFALATSGAPFAAFKAQPMGALVALGSAAAFWIALHTALLGSMAAHRALELLRPRPLWILAIFAIGAWAYKWATWAG